MLIGRKWKRPLSVRRFRQLRPWWSSVHTPSRRRTSARCTRDRHSPPTLLLLRHRQPRVVVVHRRSTEDCRRPPAHRHRPLVRTLCHALCRSTVATPAPAAPRSPTSTLGQRWLELGREASVLSQLPRRRSRTSSVLSPRRLLHQLHLNVRVY